jgi:uncharacterized protein (DUF362 family)
MSRVLVTDSTYDTCREAVERAFATFPIDIRGKRVALKMNALKAGDPDRYADEEIIKQLAREDSQI